MIRVLAQRKAAEFDIAGSGASPNYPVENLTNPILTFRHQWGGGSETITFDNPDNGSINMNCLFYGHTDMTTFTVRRYLSSVLIDTTVITTVYSNSGAVYFTLAEVDEIQVDVTGLYLGGLDFGQYEELGKPLLAVDTTGRSDTTQINQAFYGQNVNTQGVDLRTRNIRTVCKTKEIMNQYIETLSYMPKGKNIWVDIWPEERDEEIPFYGFRINDFAISRQGNIRVLSYSLREAR